METNARKLISQYPAGYRDTNWVIKRNEDEYFVKYKNEWARYFINQQFELLSFKVSWLNIG